VPKIDINPQSAKPEIVPGGLAATEAALLLWRQPSLGYGAVDDVPLNPFASWATERSQVLA
jgi:hypothetical protein